MKLINLTPHTVHIYNQHKEHMMTIESSGIARCSQEEEIIAYMGSFPITVQKFGEVIGLPRPVRATYYIVSRIVAEACPCRNDLLIPGPAIRDESDDPEKKGKIIGSTGLSSVTGKLSYINFNE